MKLVKRVAIIVIIAFAVFYVIVRPQDAANAVQAVVGAVFNVGAAIISFFTSLASK